VRRESESSRRAKMAGWAARCTASCASWEKRVSEGTAPFRRPPDNEKAEQGVRLSGFLKTNEPGPRRGPASLNAQQRR